MPQHVDWSADHAAQVDHVVTVNASNSEKALVSLPRHFQAYHLDETFLSASQGRQHTSELSATMHTSFSLYAPKPMSDIDLPLDLRA